jgi:hypothetical protein
VAESTHCQPEDYDRVTPHKGHRATANSAGRLITIASPSLCISLSRSTGEPERYLLLSFPEALQAGYCLILAHGPDLVFAHAYTGYEEMDNLGR